VVWPRNRPIAMTYPGLCCACV
jgi:hypothetical protein